MGSIPGLTQWVKDLWDPSCGVGGKLGSDLALLWLWCRLAAAAPIQPLVHMPWVQLPPQKKKSCACLCVLVYIDKISSSICCEGLEEITSCSHEHTQHSDLGFQTFPNKRNQGSLEKWLIHSWGKENKMNLKHLELWRWRTQAWALLTFHRARVKQSTPHVSLWPQPPFLRRTKLADKGDCRCYKVTHLIAFLEPT